MTHVHGRVTPCSCNVYEDQKLVFVCLETVIQKHFKSVTHSKSTHVLFILPGVKLSVDESAPLGDRMVKPGYRLSALRQTDGKIIFIIVMGLGHTRSLGAQNPLNTSAYGDKILLKLHRKCHHYITELRSECAHIRLLGIILIE